MRVGVIGSRKLTENDRERVEESISVVLQRLGQDDKVVYVIGGGPNCDRWVREFAKRSGDDYVIYLPYHRLDKNAEFSPKYFFIRNKQIISNSDVLILIHPEDEKDESSDMKQAEEFGDKKNKTVVIA